MKRLLIIILYINVFLTFISGQEVRVSAAFDSSRIYLGDHINFTVTVDKPAGLLISLPAFRDTLVKNIEILKGPVIDTSNLENGRIKITEKYLITSFDSGFYQVPPVYAELKDEAGIKRFYSDYARLEVRRVKISPPDPASKIFDIIKPYSAPITLGEIIPWILLAFLIAAFTWLLIRYFKKTKLKKSGEEPAMNPDPAHVIAFRELEKLKEEKLWQKGELKKYYTRLTEIIRQYLEDRFSVYSLEMTTAETLHELRKTGFREDDSYRMLGTVLTGADLVKFAKYRPDQAENELHFDNAWKFVALTKKEAQIADAIVEVKPVKAEGA